MISFEDLDITNVVLLTVDCLRYDTAREEMSFLADLDANNLSVADCHCVGSGTPTSMPGLHQSRLPTENGGEARAHRLPDSVPTLAEVLRADGFQTGGWHSNVYTSRIYGYQRGFEVFSDLKEHPPDERVRDDGGTDGTRASAASGSTDSRPSLLSIGQDVATRLGVESQLKRLFFWLRNRGLVDYRPHVRAGRINDAALEWLPERPDGQPRFGWLHYMDLHSPYVPPEPYRERTDGCPVADREIWRLATLLQNHPQDLDQGDVRKLRRLYRANADYVDDQLERFVEALRRRGLWEETLLVVTADHGELFDDRSIPDDYPFGHPNVLCEEVTRVPLLLAGGAVPAAEVDGIASGKDVPATIAATVGVDPPAEWSGQVIGSPGFQRRDFVVSVTGRGRRQDGTDGSIPPETLHVAARTSDRAVLWWDDPDVDSMVFDRTGGRKELTTVSEKALEAARSHIETITDGVAGTSDDVDVDEQTRARLEDLGYL